MRLNRFSIRNSRAKVIIYRILLCLVGSFLLATANAVFLTPANIIAGGVTGIGVIIAYFCPVAYQPYIVDITVLVLNVIFLILALIFLHKRFVVQTLVATFAVPFFMWVIQYSHMFDFIVKVISNNDHTSLLLGGMFGGLLVGLGCVVTFFGDGSTGGTDVLGFILNKYFGVKQSITAFTWDTTVIIIGLICIRNNVFLSLVGALSVLLSSLVIDFLYSSATTSYIADIVSDKYQEINDYVIADLNRTTSIIEITGGYSKTNKKMIRFVLDKHEFIDLKDQISLIDPKAFVTIYRAKKVLGEGFANLIAVKPSKKIKKKDKDGNK